MAGVEASGKTIDEAIEHALDELGVGRDSVDVEVLSEGKAGRLGIGGEQARVRVRLLGDDDDADDDADDGAGDDADDDDDQDDAPATGNERVDAPASGEAAEGEEDEDEEDDAEFAAQMLDQMLAMMGIEADVSIRDAETPGDGVGMAKAVLDIEGDDLGILIGRRGETLQSLQYLLNVMVGRQLSEQSFFTVDVEGYRRRRERSLTGLARKMADQVKRTKRPVQLEPMPPNERRIIHLALADDRYVTTSSTGEGEGRKISIQPRK
ncbi:MAG: RNA-binding cell elongation regulator Jag/EloR [Dehalococcoidia bacterium]